MEKLYHEAETHGQEIEEELSSVLKKREKLKEQKNKLGERLTCTCACT